jgi:hypothetical protein
MGGLMARYIDFVAREEPFHKHAIYDIVNKKSGTILGVVYYDPPWRQFVATYQEGCIFSVGCMEDIIAFIRTLK